jgi:tetratricopeptide (TPR) repeat protein
MRTLPYSRRAERRRVGLCCAVVALLGLLAPSVARAQGRASGTVLDADGKPIAGATVTLRTSDGKLTPAPVTTDGKGRWSMLGLEPERWRITVEAEGFIRGEGYVEVPEEGPGAPVTVQLRPLSEVTPGGPENPQAVILWLDKGNSLLAQGHPAEARAEYEKALAVLPPAERPQVLSAIARTWFLQGDKKRAVASVKAGLTIDPDDAALRGLLHMLLEDMGHPAEADAFLAALASRPAIDATAAKDEDADQQLPPEIAAAMAAPAEPPAAGRRGSYKVAFVERSPWSSRDEVLRRAGTPPEILEKGAPQALAYDIAKESYQVIVPAGDPPAAGWGLMVWISPGPFGGAYRPERLATLERHRLIWVGANGAGNDRNRWDRWGLALDAAWQMAKLYKVDPARVYVGGYSGGGRAASALTMLYPDVFRAGLMQMGIDYFRDLPIPDRPGMHWPSVFSKPPRELYALAHDRSRFVLLTGERDFNRAQTRVIRAELAKEGFRGVTYLEVPAVSHYDSIPAEWLEKAYSALDGVAASAAR